MIRHTPGDQGTNTMGSYYTERLHHQEKTRQKAKYCGNLIHHNIMPHHLGVLQIEDGQPRIAFECILALVILEFYGNT